MFSRKILAAAVMLVMVLVAPSLGIQFRNTISDEDFCSMCKKGDTRGVIKAIKAGANVNARCFYGVNSALNGLTTSPAIIFATMEGHTEIVKALIEAGADVNAEDRYWETALMLVGGHLFEQSGLIYSILLLAGADVSANSPIPKRNYEAAALSWAAREGRTETIKALIKAGTDVDVKKTEEDI